MIWAGYLSYFSEIASLITGLSQVEICRKIPNADHSDRLYNIVNCQVSTNYFVSSSKNVWTLPLGAKTTRILGV